MYFIGFDPGTTGAVAFIASDGALTVHDLPTVERPGDGYVRRKVAALPLAQLIGNQLDDCDARAAIEQVHTYPSQGDGRRKAQAPQIQGSLLQTAATIDAVCELCAIPLQEISPQSWKRFFGLGSDKEEARHLAIRLFPAAAGYFARKADHNRAEASLIAHWLRRTSGHVA